MPGEFQSSGLREGCDADQAWGSGGDGTLCPDSAVDGGAAPSPCRRVLRTVGAGCLLDQGQRVLHDGRRVRLHPAGLPHHGQQHHDRRTTASRSSTSPSPTTSASRSTALGEITPGAAQRSARSSPGGTPDARNYTSYTTRVADEPDHRTSAPTQAAARLRRHLDRHRARPLHLHVQDGSARRLRRRRRRTRSAIYATRNMTDIIDARTTTTTSSTTSGPDGGAVTEKWDKIRTTTPATSATTRSRRTAARARTSSSASLCHQPQTVDPDTGNIVDFKVMIHKIHRGENLPSVEAGTPYHDHRQPAVGPRFLDVVFPQDIRNCANCHKAATGARQSDVTGTRTRPARPAAPATTTSTGSPGANHPAGPQADDRACATLPPAAGRPRVGRLDQGRAHGALQVDAAEGPQGGDHLGRQRRARPEADVTFQITENDGTAVAPAPSRRLGLAT